MAFGRRGGQAARGLRTRQVARSEQRLCTSHAASRRTGTWAANSAGGSVAAEAEGLRKAPTARRHRRRGRQGGRGSRISACTQGASYRHKEQVERDVEKRRLRGCEAEGLRRLRRHAPVHPPVHGVWHWQSEQLSAAARSHRCVCVDSSHAWAGANGAPVCDAAEEGARLFVFPSVGRPNQVRGDGTTKNVKNVRERDAVRVLWLCRGRASTARVTARYGRRTTVATMTGRQSPPCVDADARETPEKHMMHRRLGALTEDG